MAAPRQHGAAARAHHAPRRSWADVVASVVGRCGGVGRGQMWRRRSWADVVASVVGRCGGVGRGQMWWRRSWADLVASVVGRCVSRTDRLVVDGPDSSRPRCSHADHTPRAAVATRSSAARTICSRLGRTRMYPHPFPPFGSTRVLPTRSTLRVLPTRSTLRVPHARHGVVRRAPETPRVVRPFSRRSYVRGFHTTPQAASKLRESDARLESLDLEFGKMRAQLHDLVATKQHLKESLQVRRVPKRNHATYNRLTCNVRPSRVQRATWRVSARDATVGGNVRLRARR
jgi:hypothetical protein